jgi:hypothetical protein
MEFGTLVALLYVVVPAVCLLLIVVARRVKRAGGSLRTSMVGATYEWHNRDKQKALDVIVEGKAAERHPEYPDGDLPQLDARGKTPAKERR